MKKLLPLAVLLAVGLASSATAATPSLVKEEVDRLVANFLPPCPDPITVSSEPLQADLGSQLRAAIVQVRSSNPWCSNAYLGLATPGKAYYLGAPWILAGLNGTPAEKIRQFAWNRLQQSVEAKVAMAPRKDGFLPVIVEEKTEYGKVRISGVVDAAGTIYLPGDVRPMTADAARTRLEGLKSVAAKAPYKGPANAKVTVYEFSDFQCPACKTSAGYGEKLVKEYGDAIRYVRIDMPLISSHPWAFPAALASRAIWKQNPEAFWMFKDEIYANQQNLDAFRIDDFARSFAKSQGLDLARFDADVRSATLKEEILAGVSASRTLQINGTPTYLVDGVPVIPGEGGGLLVEIVGMKVAAAR